MLQLNINKELLIFSTFRVYTTVNSVFCCRSTTMHSVILRRMKVWSPWGKWENHIVYMNGCFSEFYEGAPRQRHKEQVSILCHCNMARCCAGVWSLRTNVTPCHRCFFAGDSCLCRGGGSASSAPHKRKAARVVLYVNGVLFVRVLHMSITPHFNPSLCLGREHSQWRACKD